MNDQTDGWIDAALEDLAAEDARTVVPPELEAAVMRSWDVQQAARAACGSETRRPARGWQTAAVWALALAAAAGVLGVVSLVRNPAAAPDHGFSAVEGANPVGVFPIASVPPTPLAQSGVARPVTRRVAANDRPRPIETGYVIVPEPFVDPAALHVVRVRMARTALTTLGMPIVEPDAGGLVDVEMLVGDDGVALSIRNATFVGHNRDRGAEQ